MERTQQSYARDLTFFAALLSTAIALGGALAHAFELPNKIGMSREDYFIVQRIYQGWNQLAYVLGVQFAGMLVLVALYRSQRRVLWPVLVALFALIGAQVVFWIYTFPANRATANWTMQPANWETLRLQWEYSHLAGAGLQLAAMAALIVAVLRRTAP